MTDEITLLQGDCFERMKEIADGSVDMILTDPPYGVTCCKWDKTVPFAPMWEAFERIIKPNGCIAIFAGEPFSAALIMSNLKLYRYELIWRKNEATDFLNARRKPLKIHDKVQIFYKSKAIYHPQMTEGKPYDRGWKTTKTECYGKVPLHETKSENGERFPTTVIEFPREVGLHPTQKPVPLLRWLIRSYTDAGDTVLDPFMGSGSTGVACLSEGRRFIGIEREDTYFEVAKKRIEEARNGLFD